MNDYEGIILVEDYILTFEQVADDYTKAFQEENQENIADARRHYIYLKHAFFAYINQNKNKKIDSKKIKERYESIRNEYFEAIENGQDVSEEMVEKVKQSKEEFESINILKENQKNIKAAAPFIKKIRESKTIEDYIRNTNGKVYTIGNLKRRKFIKTTVVTLAGVAAIASLSVIMINSKHKKQLKTINAAQDVITNEVTNNSTEKITSDTQHSKTTEEKVIDELTSTTQTTSEPINYGIFGPEEKQNIVNNENNSINNSENISTVLNLPVHEEKIEALDPGVDVNAPAPQATTSTEIIYTPDVTEAAEVEVTTESTIKEATTASTTEELTTESSSSSTSTVISEQKNPDGTTTIVEIISQPMDVKEPEEVEYEFDFDTISSNNIKRLVMRG